MNISELARMHKTKKVAFSELHDGDVFWYDFNDQFRDLCRKDTHMMQFTNCNTISIYDGYYARQVGDEEIVEAVMAEKVGE